jgi:hypothetical protein
MNQKKKGKRTYRPQPTRVSHQTGPLTSPSENRPGYPFTVFFLGQEVARWRAARRSIHRRHSDAPDGGRRLPEAYKTLSVAAANPRTLSLTPSVLVLSIRFSPPSVLAGVPQDVVDAELPLAHGGYREKRRGP